MVRTVYALIPSNKVYFDPSKSYFKVVLAFAAGVFLLGSVIVFVNHQKAIALAHRKATGAAELALLTLRAHFDQKIDSPGGIAAYDPVSILEGKGQHHGLIRLLNERKIGAYLVYPDDQFIDLNTPGFSKHKKSNPSLLVPVASNNPFATKGLSWLSPSSSKIYAAKPIRSAQSSLPLEYLVTSAEIEPSPQALSRFMFVQLMCWTLALAAISWFAGRLLHALDFRTTKAQKKAQTYADITGKQKLLLEKMSLILKKSDDLMVLTDSAGKILWINEDCTRKNNYSNVELSSFVGRELAEVSHYAPIMEAIETVKRTGANFTYETKSFDEANTAFWSKTTISPIFNEAGDIDHLLFVDADITRLKELEAKVQTLVGESHGEANPTLRIARDHTIRFANKAGAQISKLWCEKNGTKVTKDSPARVIEEAFVSNSERCITVACDQRIFKMRLVPSPSENQLHVYGEDITEAQFAQAAATAHTNALEAHNLNLTDSMSYARRIQESILPSEDQLRKYFKNAFALSMPKDILSGDFFWIYECIPQKQYLLALADCTGHGVPGAMMSIIGHSLLNEVAENHKLHNPAEVLKTLNRELIRTLKQKNGHEMVGDGMDISLVHIDLENMAVTFSGAYHPMYWMNGKLNVIKGDRQPIGGYHHSPSRDFQNHTIKLTSGDAIYLFSDGITDQFGGPSNKKFQSRRLQNIIEENHKYSMQAQSYLLRQAIQKWRGSGEQIDDISIIGIKF